MKTNGNAHFIDGPRDVVLARGVLSGGGRGAGFGDERDFATCDCVDAGMSMYCGCANFFWSAAAADMKRPALTEECECIRDVISAGSHWRQFSTRGCNGRWGCLGRRQREMEQSTAFGLDSRVTAFRRCRMTPLWIR